MNRVLRAFGISRGAEWQFLTGDLGQPIGQFFLDCLTPEDGTDRSSRNVSKNYLSTLRNVPEERASHFHRGGSLRSRININSS